jgi:hypothetical protein
MKKKNPQKGLRMMPLLRCEVIPITDPAEIAALERRIRAAEKVMVDGYARLEKTKPRKRKPAKS